MATCDSFSCRKRARSDPDDCEECVPISKRINNLHIRHSTEGWDELEYTLGEGFNNNMPGQAACCQLSPTLDPAQQGPLQHIPGQSTPNCSHQPHRRNVHIPGLPFDARASETTTPDINHNNPLLSPLSPDRNHPHSLGLPNPGIPNFPLQPCPSYDYSPELNSAENPYYFQINGELFKAHLDRTQRVQVGNPNVTFPGV